jgi:8-oxo-dGTP pyrophosphatase MutT (NUDIX family)
MKLAPVRVPALRVMASGVGSRSFFVGGNRGCRVDRGNEAGGLAPTSGAERRLRPVEIFHRSAGAVVLDGERCLIVRQGREWVFPKGHIERDEKPEQAALREVREETGIQAAIDGPIGVSRYEFVDHRGGQRNRKTVDWFLAHRTGGEVRVEPIFTAGGFVDREEVLDLLAHEADREIARRAFGMAPDETA